MKLITILRMAFIKRLSHNLGQYYYNIFHYYLYKFYLLSLNTLFHYIYIIFKNILINSAYFPLYRSSFFLILSRIHSKLLLSR